MDGGSPVLGPALCGLLEAWMLLSLLLFLPLVSRLMLLRADAALCTDPGLNAAKLTVARGGAATASISSLSATLLS